MVKTLAPLVEGGGGGQAFFLLLQEVKKEGIPAVLREAAQLTESLAGQKNNTDIFC